MCYASIDPAHVARAVLVAAVLTLGAAPAAAQEEGPIPRCRPAGDLVSVPDLPEGSGLALSRRTSGRLWSHNDSGDPVLIALDQNGAVTGRLRVRGAEVDDWEAIAVGPCPAGSCLYVADIGDNDAERRRITIYRIPEPEGAVRSATVADVLHATYADGAHDAEALLITPDGRLHIVTKGDTGPVAVYRFPDPLQPGTTMRLERVGGTRERGRPRENDRITDGDVSPDGEWVALRSKRFLTFYRTADLLAGRWHEASRVDLRSLDEPQGEGVAIGADGTVYLVGEGSKESKPGTFARLSCSFD